MRLYPSHRWILQRQSIDHPIGYWAHRVQPVRSEWCEESIRLPGALSVSPRFSFIGREYLREIVDAVDDPSTTEIVFLAGTQIGKTETVRAIVTSQGDVDRAPMMLAGPDQDYAREQRDYIYLVCEASPVLADRVPSVHERNDRGIDLDGAYCYLAWSGSSQRLSGRSCKVVLCSEADRWKHSLNLARQRTKAFWRSCVVCEGAPVGASPVLDDMYQASDWRTYRVPCPHCGHYQELRFFPHKDGPHTGKGGIVGLQDTDGKYLSPRQARKDAKYVCEQGCVIEHSSKGEMIRCGVWCPAGCRVIDGTVVGTPTYDTRRRGYRLNSLYSPTTSFGDAAEEWLTCRDTEVGRQSFFNDWLGMKYSAHHRQAKWTTIGTKLQHSHERGTVPAQALFLTVGCDVQEEETFWVVRAWGDGGTSWLVDWGSFPAQVDAAGDMIAGSHLAPLAEVFDRSFPVAGGANVFGVYHMEIVRAGIDCGFLPRMVDGFVRSLRDSRVCLVRGLSSPGERPYREMETEDGMVYTGINTGSYKSDINDRWSLPPDTPGAWRIPYLHDLAVAEKYLRQLCNEVKKIVINPKTNHSSEQWILVDHGLRADYLDCEVYAATMADVVAERDWDGLFERILAEMAFDQESEQDEKPFVRRPGQWL